MGKTLGLLTQLVVSAKHPHARGEDGRVHCPVQDDLETPPRTWGRQVVTDLAVLGLRNTPTHVGKTFPSYPNRIKIRKHPHARGED